MTTENNSAVAFGSLNVTPGFTPVNDQKAVEFVQGLTLDTQLGAMLGNPEHFVNDPDAYNAIVNVRDVARKSAERLKGVTGDLTITSPVRHENAAKVAGVLVDAAEATHGILGRRAKDYMTAAENIFGDRFKPNPTRDGIYGHWVGWIGNKATDGQNNGYRQITEAITDDPDAAVVLYNFNYRLLNLPEKDAFMFKERIVEKFAPDALAHIETSHQLDKVAKRYPDFVTKVHASFYSPLELAKTRTRFAL